MLNHFTEQLIGDTELLILQVNSSESNALLRLSKILNVIQDALKQLREYVSTHSFQDENHEIDFFKNLKPRLYANLIYYTELFQLEKDQPYGTVEMLKNYYSQEIDFRTSFFRRNQFLYEYYHTKMVELDNLYFLRDANLPPTMIFAVPEITPGFSTSGDYLFSKFIAYEKLCEEILRRLNLLTDQPVSVQSPKPQPKLTWTGDKVNIAELAYGLYYTGQINGGNCDVTDIISWLEDSLNLQMGSVHRKFIDIRRRKTISYTKFLDSMREAIHQRIDEDLTYKPNRGIKLQNQADDQ